MIASLRSRLEPEAGTCLCAHSEVPAWVFVTSLVVLFMLAWALCELIWDCRIVFRLRLSFGAIVVALKWSFY